MKVYGWLLLAVYLVFFGCTVPEINEVMLATQLQDAQQAINRAAELEAEALVPEEYGRAVKLLNFAHNAQKEGDTSQSGEFAYQAELVAQIARAKARQHQAQQQVTTIREQTYQQIIKTLKYEHEAVHIRQVITEKQLDHTLDSHAKVQQVKEQLLTEIADLKGALRQAEFRLPLTNLEALTSATLYFYPAIETTVNYEKTQLALASIANLIEREDFAEAEKVIAKTQPMLNSLYELARQKWKEETDAKTSAWISIAKAEVIIQRAQLLNASQHEPQRLEETSAQLQRATQALTKGLYEQASQSAQQAQRMADDMVTIVEMIEFKERSQAKLNLLIAKAEQAVQTLGEKIAEQKNTEVPQLGAELYENAKSKQTEAEAALEAKEYQAAIEAAAEGTGFLTRAVENTQQLTSIKSDLIGLTKKIAKVSDVIELPNSVLIRIKGNVFAPRSASLQEDFFPTFAELAEILQRNDFRAYLIRIESHTSSLGSAHVNRNLSIARAAAVKNYFIDTGNIDIERLTAAGLGEDKPIATEGTDKMEHNHRIDIIIKTN